MPSLLPPASRTFYGQPHSTTSKHAKHITLPCSDHSITIHLSDFNNEQTMEISTFIILGALFMNVVF